MFVVSQLSDYEFIGIRIRKLNIFSDIYSFGFEM